MEFIIDNPTHSRIKDMDMHANQRRWYRLQKEIIQYNLLAGHVMGDRVKN